MKNAQNLLQTVLRGVHAAETACMTVNIDSKLCRSCDIQSCVCASVISVGVKVIAEICSHFGGFEAARAKLRWCRGHGLVFPVEEEAGDPSSPGDH